MQRRSFFRWIAGTAAAVIYGRVPSWASTQTFLSAPDEAAMLRALGAVVLPTALVPGQIDVVVAQFVDWCANYKVGADLGYGYGHPRTRLSGPNPDRAYASQLRALGPHFLQLAPTAQRSIVEAALQKVGVTSMPRRPDGRHVASDLMGYFFNGPAGEDFLFRASVMREACRGLDQSDQRPAPLRS